MSKQIFNNIWHFAGSIYLTAGLFIISILDLLTGYYQLKSNPHLFHPLNDMGFIKWAQTYGRGNLIETSWLFILICLLALISINTFVCTTERVAVLFKNQAAFKQKQRFILKFAPHIMHYALLIMLFGYMVSYLSAKSYVCNILLPGKNIQIPDSSCVINLDKLHIDYYDENRLQYMQNRAIHVSARLTIKDKNKAKTSELSFNQPIWFPPYSIHLKNFAPKSRNSMDRRSFINLIIKRDPGVKYYFGGMVIFIVGLSMYIFQWIKKHNRHEDIK